MNDAENNGDCFVVNTPSGPIKIKKPAEFKRHHPAAIWMALITGMTGVIGMAVNGHYESKSRDNIENGVAIAIARLEDWRVATDAKIEKHDGMLTQMLMSLASIKTSIDMLSFGQRRKAREQVQAVEEIVNGAAHEQRSDPVLMSPGSLGLSGAGAAGMVETAAAPPAPKPHTQQKELNKRVQAVKVRLFGKK